ncbi:guanylate-binding protein 1-like [Hyla sarda]|uniref:guanylate-binding protein 1-like n=1 Tax=Hyla sarda TaxID=327740 RepID=UPI0024C3C2A7|nr:guanylate-binding protein 1-like [Hyla sarda]
MAPIPTMSKPICLIENSGGKPCVNEEAKKVLENILQPLVVVSIVGQYRSGKSYLLNKLSKGGFSLGHTLNANTKGIWMKCIPHPKKSDHTLILLDTEGVGDVEKGNLQNDDMILSLAVLMSSAVIYNSKAAINQDAVKKLHTMTGTYQFISEKASKQNGQDVQAGDDDHMSSLLVWAVRDFTLKLEINGRPVTADEYLENSLQDITPVKTPRTQEQNKVRKTIRKCFPKRKCFVFDFPLSDLDMSTLDQVSETKLQPRFVEQTKDFCEFILQEVPPKRLRGGMTATGSRFAHLLQSYLDVVKEKDFAILTSSFSNMFITENGKMMDKSIEVYEAKMSSQNVKSREEFEQIHKATEEEAKLEFNKLYVKHEKSQDEYQAELKAELLKKKDEVWKTCEESSLQRCNAIIEQLKSTLDQNIKENKYHTHGGLKTFINDKNVIIEEYKQKQDKGVKAEHVLQIFLSSLEPIEEIISKAEKEEEISAPKPKILKMTDRNDPTQLTQYIQSYQLPPGPFKRILIQLFGFAGHGKSSFVNSCIYAVNGGNFNDYAGEATSQGGKTLDRRGYQLTNNITIVDNRGFAKLDSTEEWEIYAQLCNCVPLNEMVSWNKSLEERLDLVTQRALEETSDVVVPVLIYSSQQSLGEELKNIREFLKQAQILTRILPFIVLTKSKMVKQSTLKDKFLQMGMENVYCIENYLQSDHLSLLTKHRNILTVLYDILDAVNFHMMTKSNLQNQRREWMSFLMKRAGSIQR